MSLATVLAAQLTAADVGVIVAIVVLLLGLVYLAAAETALNRISKVKAQALAEEQPSRATRALHTLVARPERFINPLLVMVTILQTAQAFLTTILADRLFGAIGVIVGFVLNVVVFFVLAEALPKTWAVLHSERAALATARPVLALVSFPPLRIVSNALIGLANVLLPGKGLKQGPFVSERELLGIVEAAAEDEVIEHEERELIESIIEFGDTVAREIMVPRPDMVTLSAGETVSEALDMALEHGFSRFPVVGENVDEVLGIAYTKDLTRAEREGKRAQPVAAIVRPAVFVPETKPVARLMREMQAGKFHMAMLVDEYGGIAGLVTLEDCIEELIGEIVDEYDVEDHDVERLADGELRVDGGLAIDELNELLEADLPDSDWDTVGGFVLSTLGHVPHEGESVEYRGHRFTAERMEGHRIARVRVAPVPGWEAPDGVDMASS
jgi:CBS domain containing-hemolysin-like protein